MDIHAKLSVEANDGVLSKIKIENWLYVTGLDAMEIAV
jgi:hypothetical protein